jgi:RING-box protein 1
MSKPVMEPQQSKMYQVLQFNAVAMWVYNNIGDSCSICKNPLNVACINCQSNQEDDEEEKKCQKVMGKCNHLYHIHCIDMWIKKQNTCPLCYTEWEATKYID